MVERRYVGDQVRGQAHSPMPGFDLPLHRPYQPHCLEGPALSYAEGPALSDVEGQIHLALDEDVLLAPVATVQSHDVVHKPQVFGYG